MDSTKDNLKEIKKLLDSKLISNEDYYALRDDILGEEMKEVRENQITILRETGKNVLNIFYCIIIQPFIAFLYWFFIGFKFGYNSANGDSNSFDNFIEYIKNLSFIFYFIEFIIAIIFLLNLWNIGVNLKNVNKKL